MRIYVIIYWYMRQRLYVNWSGYLPLSNQIETDNTESGDVPLRENITKDIILQP